MTRSTALFGINSPSTRYRALIGTGGIGSGIFCALDGSHTLGREESRSGHFLDRRDYCKLHIVSHYVCRLLGSDFPVIPLGMVGADEVGDRLLGEMAEVGLDLRYVGRAEGRGTLYALCLIYPDGSGGNVTENDSACAAVDASWIARAEAEFARFAGRGIALALPEVPLAARWKILALGTAYGFLRVASFTTAEILELDGELNDVDLLALNLDEAAALAGISTETIDSDDSEAALKTTDHCSGVEASAGFSRCPPDRLKPLLQEDSLSRSAAPGSAWTSALKSAPPAPRLRGERVSPQDWGGRGAAFSSAVAPGSAWTSVLKGALARLKPGTKLIVTAGARGSWAWDGATLSHLSALPVRAVGTAGAGDAHLAGIIAGLAAGLPLRVAHELGVLTAAVAVQSPHTINFELDRDALRACAETTNAPLADAVRALLQVKGACSAR